MNGASSFNSLFFEMLNQINKIEKSFLTSKEFKDLTITDFHTIEQIGMSKTPTTMSEVSNMLGITLGTLTTAIKRLDSKEYIKREKSIEDKRTTYLRLTTKGENAFNAHSLFHAEIMKLFESKMNKDEQDAFLKGLENFKQFFKEKFNFSGD